MSDNKNAGNKIKISGNNNSIENIHQTVNEKVSSKLDNTPSSLKEKIIELISKNFLGEAILLIQTKKPDLEKSCVILSRRLHTLKLGTINGIFSNEEYNLELNKITKGILDLIE